MSVALEQSAIRALRQSGFTKAKGMCQRFVRENIQRVYGSRFDQYHKASAKESAQAWQKSQYAFSGSQPTVPGDVLYYTTPEHGPHGHVAIRIHGNQVAENSIVHFGDDEDGRGTRPLEALGRPSLVVRLPEPSPLRTAAHHD